MGEFLTMLFYLQHIPDSTGSPPQQNLKNGNVASATNRRQQENINLLKVTSFVKETLKTSSNYREKFTRYNTIQLDFNLTQLGMLI